MAELKTKKYVCTNQSCKKECIISTDGGPNKLIPHKCPKCGTKPMELIKEEE